MVGCGSELLSNVGVLLSRRDHDGCHWVIISLLYLVVSCSGVWSTFDLTLSCDVVHVALTWDHSFLLTWLAIESSLFGNVMLMTSSAHYQNRKSPCSLPPLVK